LDLVCASNIPPLISALDFVNFYTKCQIPDEHLKPSSLDLVFVQVDTNNRTRVGINRGEFIETLVRIAKVKYKDTGICRSIDEAFAKLC
jgi:hypothetical protein